MTNAGPLACGNFHGEKVAAEGTFGMGRRSVQDLVGITCSCLKWQTLSWSCGRSVATSGKVCENVVQGFRNNLCRIVSRVAAPVC